MENNVDFDQMSHSAAFDLGLHHLLKSLFSNARHLLVNMAEM